MRPSELPLPRRPAPRPLPLSARREDGRQKKEFVPMRRLSEVLFEMESQRAKAGRPAEVQRVLKELRNV